MGKRVVAAVIGGLAAAGGLYGLTPGAKADPTFQLQRIAGSDRYQTAGNINLTTYPSGEATVLLADGLAAHQPDALAASGLEGVNSEGVLLTDNTDNVPTNTLSALQSLKVKNIVVLGGYASVSQAQVAELQNDKYNVTTPYQGQTRYQTMEMIDYSISPSSVGTDSNGDPTAILASGDNNHYVDALSAGALAYAKKFPIILTNSQGPDLSPEAQAVIGKLGIKHLIVVGGTASIPSSEYSPKPSGVTTVDVEAGNDRSQTSSVLSDFAISKGWLANTNMDVARGDDGSDALAGSSFGGVKGFPTLVTNSTSDAGSATSFANEHQTTLTGTSYVFGGTAAVTDSQMQSIQQAAGSNPAPAGTISPTSSQVVTAVASNSFAQGGFTYTYKSGDTYQIQKPSSSPTSSSPSCQSDTYADFQARLSKGDQVTGNYQPSQTSTFCLVDQAPHPPASPTATSNPNNSQGGVVISWTAPSTAATDGVSEYIVWRDTASGSSSVLGGTTYSCPNAAYTTAPGSSPQNTPDQVANSWTQVTTVPASSSNTNYSIVDTSEPYTSSTPDFCYAVSSASPSGAGPVQIGTAAPANPASGSATPGAVAATQGTGSAPTISSVTTQGWTIAVNYNETINPSTVDTGDFAITMPTPVTPTATNAAGSVVYIDLGQQIPVGMTPKVTVQKSSSDSNTVCAASSTSACEAVGDSATSSPATQPGPAPSMTIQSASSSNQTIVLKYAPFAIDCGTVTSKDFTASSSGVGLQVQSAGCSDQSGTASPAGTQTSEYVVVKASPFLPSQSVTVTASGTDPDGNTVIYSPNGSEQAPGNTSTATSS
ncbi:MAG TPA: cell wall-binding repeat-containing protein [Acidimicrobiales bacterium]|nr:cell wall-binding repeat-containing protein [Acidimicrobiales bacterium]